MSKTPLMGVLMQVGVLAASTALWPLAQATAAEPPPVLATAGVTTPWPGVRPGKRLPMTRAQAQPHAVACVFSADQCHHAAEAAGFHHFQLQFNPQMCPQEPHLLCLGFH